MGPFRAGARGTIHRGGGRYVSLVCGSEVFHISADRWPDAIDVTSLAHYASAAHMLAQT